MSSGDGSSCDRGRYVAAAKDYVVLKDFFASPSTRRFIELSELEPPCQSGRCSQMPSGHEVDAADLVFFSAVASVDRKRKCGERICTIMGNVESARGILYKLAEPSGGGPG